MKVLLKIIFFLFLGMMIIGSLSDNNNETTTSPKNQQKEEKLIKKNNQDISSKHNPIEVTGDLIEEKGSKVAIVKKVQNRLKELGYKIEADGIYGPKTRNVIKEFQVNNNLKADGIIGKNTYDKILNSNINNGVDKKEETDRKVKLVDYKISKIEDVSYSNIKRYSLKVVIKEKASSQQLKKVSKQIVENFKNKHSFNALSIYMYDYEEFISGVYTLARIDFAPSGDWSEADSVSTGDYDKMDFTWDIKEKNWDRQLTTEEAKIYGYFDNLLWNTTLEEDDIKEKTANKFDVSEKEIERIIKKQNNWIYSSENSAPKKSEGNYFYEILKKTTNSNGTRLEILLTEGVDNITKEGLEKFITKVTNKYNDIAGAVYLTEEAYQEDVTGNYTDQHKSGLLLSYVKNSRAKQMTFMQEKGKFENLFGITIKLIN